MHVQVIAQIQVRPEAIDELQRAWLAVVEPTRAEPGNHRYEIFQNEEDPTHFVAVEEYSSPEAFQAHMGSSYIQALFAVAQTLLAAPPSIKTYRKLA